MKLAPALNFQVEDATIGETYSRTLYKAVVRFPLSITSPLLTSVLSSQSGAVHWRIKYENLFWSTSSDNRTECCQRSVTQENIILYVTRLIIVQVTSVIYHYSYINTPRRRVIYVWGLLPSLWTATLYPPNENRVGGPFPIFFCRVGGGCTQAMVLHISLGVNSINKGSLDVCRGIYSSSCLNSTANVNLIVSISFIRNYLRDKP